MSPRATRPALTGARCAVVLFLVGGTLWAAPGAQAAPTVDFVICEEGAPSSPSPSPSPSPGPQCTPQADSVVKGGVLVVFDVQEGSLENLVEVELLAESDIEGAESTQLDIWTGGDAQPGRYVHEWSSTVHPNYNGAFTLTVRAVSDPVAPGGPNEETQAQHGPLIVDNPPKLPQKPEVTGVDADGVSVRWPAAAEPDVEDYTLYRARTGSAEETPSDGAFRRIFITPKTSTVDRVSEGGAYWYKVRVTRKSVVTPDEGISSTSLSARSDSAGVYVPPTPTPPPPEGAGDDGGETEAPRPRLTPRPLPRPARDGGPPLPADAPFSDILPYDLPQDGSGGGDVASGETDREPGDGDRGAVPAIAMGTFLVSAALALGRAS